LAVAVQQGSHLVKLISKTILELQKERYFEQLTSKKQDSSLISNDVNKKNKFPPLVAQPAQRVDYYYSSSIILAGFVAK
jgi:hypothetical protein